MSRIFYVIIEYIGGVHYEKYKANPSDKRLHPA